MIVDAAYPRPRRRVEGLDLARLLALVGMVLVNFRMVMDADGQGWLETAFGALEGRAAALFVILAGVGLGLSTAGKSWIESATTTVRRAAFLLVLGLVNTVVFDADILHYYAVYFVFGAAFLRAPSSVLAYAAAGLTAGFAVMTLGLDYDAGWDWETFSYAGFWTPGGFIRNLFFNGWHPVIPWLAFLLLGLALARLRLNHRPVQLALLAGGGALWLIAELCSAALVGWAGAFDADLAYLLDAAPIPPGPFYMLAAGGASCVLIALCLIAAPALSSAGVLAVLAPAGRQTLTLYMAHIYLGMGAIEAFGLIGGQRLETVVAASALFCLAAIGFTFAWSRRWTRGPLEAAMRRVAG